MGGVAVMFSRAAVIYTPQCTQVRGMATLKEISIRLKSVKNIQKITKSMKMVSAAKFARAERDLRVARPYGEAARRFYDCVDVEQDEKAPNRLVLAITSDRGLCGAVNSSIVKQVREDIDTRPANADSKVIAVGEKAKALLQRKHKDYMMVTFSEIGKLQATFGDATEIANSVLQSGYNFDHGTMYFNIFKSVISYTTTKLPIYSLPTISSAEKLSVYDSLDEDVLRCYNEFSLASLVFYALKENSASEQSSRMTAMEAANKNAGEMIDKLTLKYTRPRQAVITTELIDIVTGASAL